MESKAERSEVDVFNDLTELCNSDGFIHALAYLAFRDNVITYPEHELTPDDIGHLFSHERLIRSELTTLIGLMVKGNVSLELPTPGVNQSYIDNADVLLKDLHETFLTPFKEKMAKLHDKSEPFFNGGMIREAVFYGAESAYNFQYKDFADKRYAPDSDWILEKKGFVVKDALSLADIVTKLQNVKIEETLEGFKDSDPNSWTFLPPFTFTVEEISENSELEPDTVRAILREFSVEPNSNASFQSIGDFNISYAKPFIKKDDDTYFLFNAYGFVESIYESPFYWMLQDGDYKDVCLKNRGDFTENICDRRLKDVFGENNVYANVEIKNGSEIVGEIDVLVVFSDWLFVVQAKSKKLTMEARKGNDLKIQDDFKKSVQDSYDQGLSCSKFILSPDGLKFLTAEGNELQIPSRIKDVFIICSVSDHYPSLSFQVREYLKYEQTDVINPPFVMDIFTLDAICEMLDTPLHFINYIKRRVGYFNKLTSSHELVILSDHLKRNLWVEEENSFVLLDDSISSDLDVAMMVRREGIPGKATPSGLLTLTKEGTLGNILTGLERKGDSSSIMVGLFILMLGGEAFQNMSEMIDRMIGLTCGDGQNHDASFPIESEKTGITFHCNFDNETIALPRLHSHCELRKYLQKADHWFGVLLDPTFKTVRKIIALTGAWKLEPRLEMKARGFRPRAPRTLASYKTKISRNSPCPCGSGKKYKRCCMN